MEKAIIYARVSTKEQAEEGYSLASQMKLLREYAERNELEITKEFEVPESASGHQERKTFKEMLGYCKKHSISHILCEKVDRMTRNLNDAVFIDSWIQANTQRRVHFVKQNLVIHQNAKSYEKFQWDIYVVLARQYSNNLSEETRKGLQEKAEEGWYPGPTKRGYVTVGEQGHKVWEIDHSEKSEALFIAKAFNLYAHQSHTITTLWNALYKEGWTGSAGNKLARNTIYTILTDPFYCGKFHWSGREYEGKHEPLISEETFDLVQKKLKRALKDGKYKKHVFLYGNLLRCEGCGSSVSAEIQKGHVYYRCTRYKPCKHRKCTNEEAITAQVRHALDVLKISSPHVRQWLLRVLKECHQEEKAYHTKVMKNLTDHLQRIKARIDLLYDNRAEECIDKEFFEEKLMQYQRQQREVIRKIDRHKDAGIRYAKTASDIIEISQRAMELFEEIGVEDKKILFKFILQNPRLNNGKLYFEYQGPFNKLHEIATFQPQKNLITSGQSGDITTSYPSMLPEANDFPTDLSGVDKLEFLQDMFGVLEFPAMTVQIAERFASMKL
jgi:site-specific DNA recombinase